MSRLLTIGQVVENYGRTRYFWRKQAKAGRIAYSVDPDNGAHYFESSDIESYLARLTIRPSRLGSSAQRKRAAIRRIVEGL